MVNLLFFSLFPGSYLNLYERENRKISSGFVFLAVILISFAKILIHLLMYHKSPEYILPSILWWPGLVLFSYIFVFLFGSLIAFYADLSHKTHEKSDRASFYFFFILTYSPLLLTPGVAVLYKFFVPQFLNFYFIYLAFFVWIFILQIKTISQFFKFSGIQAVFAYFFAFIFLGIYFIVYFFNLIFSLFMR